MKRALRFLPMIAVMVIIFLFSAMPGDESAQQSGVFLKALALFVEEFSRHGISDKAMGAMHLIIRKCAHFTEYAALGAASFYAFKDIMKRHFGRMLLPLTISFLYACTDEFHQYHVPGRYGTFSDVLIDLSGAIVGTLIIYLISRHIKLKLNK